MEESVWEGEEKRQGWWDGDDDDDDEAEGGTRGLTMTTQMHQPH